MCGEEEANGGEEELKGGRLMCGEVGANVWGGGG